MHEPSSPHERDGLSTSGSFDRILATARAGGDRAWRELYRSVAPPLTRYLQARGVPDVDDIVGETFVRIVRNVAGFHGDEAAFRTWAFTIARNLVVDEARRRTRRPADAAPLQVLVALTPTGDVEAEAMELVAREHVQAVLASLSQDQRDVLFLRILAELTIAEIAQIVGKREGAVKMLQARGLAAIRKKISEEAVTL